jgi:preprotein translocase subunit SecF
MEQENKKNFYEKYYKLFLVLPLAFFLFSFLYMANFYSDNGDFIKKDISLTGGTSVTLIGNFDASTLKADLSSKLEDLNTREVYDLVTNEKKAVILETASDSDQTKAILEQYLGYELNSENSSFEFTGSSLSESFYHQLLIAVWIAFILMGLVVFLIFGEKKLIKLYASVLSLLGVKLAYSSISIIYVLSIFLIFVLIAMIFYFSVKQKKSYLLPVAILVFSAIMIFFPSISSYAPYLFLAGISVILGVIYFIFSIPSFAVIISAFADILMTLVLVDILGMRISGAGIVAFLMLIGYSVDTDILLTTRILKRTEDTINKRLFSAFKTGITMTLTSLFAVGAALIIVRSFSEVLGQIFSIIFIGLCFDIFNTWITNASIIKWYAERKK